MGLPTVHLLVVERKGGPVYYVKWLDAGSQVKRRLGWAWIERGRSASSRRRTRHEGWVRRRGRPPQGWLTEEGAMTLIPDVVADYEAARDGALDEARREAQRVAFEEIAQAWLTHRITVVGIKRSTQNDYAAMLRRPDEAPAKR